MMQHPFQGFVEPMINQVEPYRTQADPGQQNAMLTHSFAQDSQDLLPNQKVKARKVKSPKRGNTPNRHAEPTQQTGAFLQKKTQRPSVVKNGGFATTGRADSKPSGQMKKSNKRKMVTKKVSQLDQELERQRARDDKLQKIEEMKENVLFPKTIEKFYSQKQKESLVNQKANIQDQIDRSLSSSNSRQREKPSSNQISIKEKLKRQQKNAIAEERDEHLLTKRSSQQQNSTRKKSAGNSNEKILSNSSIHKPVPATGGSKVKSGRRDSNGTKHQSRLSQPHLPNQEQLGDYQDTTNLLVKSSKQSAGGDTFAKSQKSKQSSSVANIASVKNEALVAKETLTSAPKINTSIDMKTPNSGVAASVVSSTKNSKNRFKDVKETRKNSTIASQKNHYSRESSKKSKSINRSRQTNTIEDEQRDIYVGAESSKMKKSKDQRPPIARDLKLVSHDVQNIEQIQDIQKGKHKKQVQSYGESLNSGKQMNRLDHKTPTATNATDIRSKDAQYRFKHHLSATDDPNGITVGQERPDQRPDWGKYPALDPQIPLADQVQVSDIGSSGYSTDESKFDEEYYQEWQEYIRKKKQLEDRRELKRKNQTADLIFNSNFTKFLKFKQQTDLEDKFYNPYKLLAQQKAIEKEKKDKLEGLQEQERVIMEVQMKKELKKVVKGLIKGDVPISEHLSAAEVASDPVLLLSGRLPGQEKLSIDELSDDEKSDSAESVESTKYKENERQYLAKVYTGQQPELKIPIEQNDDQSLDEQRAQAFCMYREQKPLLQIDQCPYESKHHGLCQLVFIYRQKCHALQIQLYQAHDDHNIMRKQMKMNREVNLKEFKIENPNQVKRDEITNVTDEKMMAPDQIRKRRENKDKNYLECIQKLIKVIRKIKSRITGDVYEDFFNYGYPSQQDYSSSNWHNFTVHLMAQNRLKAEVSNKLEQRVREKFFQSEAYLMLKQKNNESEDGDANPKKNIVQKLMKVQYMVKHMVRKIRDQKLRDARLRYLQQKNNFITFKTIQGKFQFHQQSKVMDAQLRKDKISSIYLKIRVKCNPEINHLQIHAYDLNPNRKLKKIVQTFDHPFNHSLIEMMKQNLNYFIEQNYFIIKESRFAPGQLEFDLSKLQDPQVAESLMEFFHNDVDHSLARATIVAISEVNEGSENGREQGQPFGSDMGNPYSLGNLANHKNGQMSPIFGGEFDLNKMSAPEIEGRRKPGKKSTSKSPAGKRRGASSGWRSDSNQARYGAVFANRKNVQVEQEYFKQAGEVKIDEDMWRHLVTDPYQYSVLKIQQWWRKRIFNRLIESAIMCNSQFRASNQQYMLKNNCTVQIPDFLKEYVGTGKMPRDMDSGGFADKVANIQHELNVLKNDGNLQLVRNIQRYFRMKRMIKKCRDRFIGLSANKENKLILYKCIREFYENEEDITPNNYMMVVTNYSPQENEEPAEGPCFLIQMYLNNKVENYQQQLDIKYDLFKENPTPGLREHEMELLQTSQRHYFDHLINSRLTFTPYTKTELEMNQKRFKMKVLSYDPDESGQWNIQMTNPFGTMKETQQMSPVSAQESKPLVELTQIEKDNLKLKREELQRKHLPDGVFSIQSLFAVQMSAGLLRDIKAQNKKLHKSLSIAYQNSAESPTLKMEGQEE